MEEKELNDALDEKQENLLEKEEVAEQSADEPLDKNIKLMSPTRMVVRRFFRSKLSIIGLVMVIGLFIFSFFGPLIYNQWGETELDEGGKIIYTTTTVTVTDENGESYEIKQTIEKKVKAKGTLASPPQRAQVAVKNSRGPRVAFLRASRQALQRWGSFWKPRSA